MHPARLDEILNGAKATQAELFVIRASCKFAYLAWYAGLYPSQESL